MAWMRRARTGLLLLALLVMCGCKEKPQEDPYWVRGLRLPPESEELSCKEQFMPAEPGTKKGLTSMQVIRFRNTTGWDTVAWHFRDNMLRRRYSEEGVYRSDADEYKAEGEPGIWKADKKVYVFFVPNTNLRISLTNEKATTLQAGDADQYTIAIARMGDR